MLEAAGKNCPDDERMLWQGLDQLMVGITHVRRGNVEGAIALLRRASARPAHYEPAAPYAIDVAGLVDSRRADGPEMSPPVAALGWWVDAAAVDEYQRCAGGTVDGIQELDHHGSADLVAGRTRQGHVT